jgi:LysR family transcriptional regulator for metE and metH
VKEKLNPKLNRITLRQFRALSAVSKTGTIKAAARILNVTPPAVTQQMHQLEAAVGIPLFERTAQGLQPTDAGRELLDTAARIEAAIHECDEALEALAGVDSGRVAVGFVSTAKYFAPTLLAAFMKRHPQVDMRLQIGNRATVIAALRDLEIDFAVTGRPPEEFEVESTAIAKHPHVIVAPPDHALASRNNISFKTLAEEKFLLREPGSGTRLLMQRLFSEVGLSPNRGMEIGSNETIKQAVIAGLGIALISAHTVAAEISDGRLTVLDVDGFPVVREWFVVKRRHKRLLPAPQALWDFFVADGVKVLDQLVRTKPAPQR